jgi:hypothetical protein
LRQPHVLPTVFAAALPAIFSPSAASAEEPFYQPPGALIPGSGQGRVDAEIYSPGMRFPIEAGPAYPNSQVWGVGGYNGPPGSQCSAKNYAYPWFDNYCETRSWTMPLCPSGTGHQGQDIRPSTCEKMLHWTVAAATATVTNVADQPSDYALYITGADGTRWDYLHGGGGIVSLGQEVAAGSRLDMVSNNFGGTPTSIHLHFNIRQDVAGHGFVYVPPYMSLVESYKQLMGLGSQPPIGAFDAASCGAIRGWAQDPDEPEAAISALLYFDGQPSDPDNTGVQVLADRHRDDLCMSLGSCAHGFEIEVPRSLRDGLEHTVYAFASDDGSGPAVELDDSPQRFTCAPPAIPEGVRRWVGSPEVLAAWRLSPFWDLAKLPDASVAAIPVGVALGEAPVVVQADDGSETLWLIDQGLRRLIPSPAIAMRWGLDVEDPEIWAAASLLGLREGTDLRPEPLMVKGSGPQIYLIDDYQCAPEESSPLCQSASGTGDDSEGGDPDSSGSGSGSGSGGTDGGSGDSGGPALPDGFGQAEEDGCGCRSAGGAGSVLALLVLLGWRRKVTL